MFLNYKYGLLKVKKNYYGVSYHRLSQTAEMRRAEEFDAVHGQSRQQRFPFDGVERQETAADLGTKYLCDMVNNV